MNELITIEGGIALLTPEAAQQVAEYERAIKRLKEQSEALKTAILLEMEAMHVIKVESEDVSISYVAATSRETFDAKLFRSENPDIYDAYVRISGVKPSLRVKLK